ncbi:glycosyltransferase family 2 protein [Breznakiellaceae bacterium SP9]
MMINYNTIKPLVSIIVPIYKSEKYIARCLESLVNQTFRDIEIICVNDGSPDNARQFVRNMLGRMIESSFSPKPTKDFLLLWQGEGRKLVKVGVVFDTEKRNIGEWKQFV